jgi:Trypsin-co-occurring domain 1
MAKTLIRVPIGDGSDDFIEAEVDTRELGESVRLTADAGLDPVTAPFTLASSVDRVMPALSKILAQLRSAAHAPDEVGMELGLKIGGETGLIFAKGTAEATFTLKLAWKRPGDNGDAVPSRTDGA